LSQMSRRGSLPAVGLVENVVVAVAVGIACVWAGFDGQRLVFNSVLCPAGGAAMAPD
jgi:hypothetical protein